MKKYYFLARKRRPFPVTLTDQGFPGIGAIPAANCDGPAIRRPTFRKMQNRTGTEKAGHDGLLEGH
jgi:hypothetical protein